jgi:multidrug efflux system outer membrane protein
LRRLSIIALRARKHGEVHAAARVCLLAGAIVGCSVGSRYVRPEVPMPSRWSGAPETTSSLADVAWWRLFQDTVLQELIRTALNQNKNIQLAVARVRETRAAFVVQRGTLFPQFDAQAYYTNERYSQTAFPFSVFATASDTTRVNPEQELHTTVFNLSYELDVWGRLRQATKAAHADNLSSARAAQTVLITLVSDVAQTYFELLELDREAIIDRRTIASLQASLALVRRRFDAGLTSELDVRRAELELAAAAATLPSVEQRIAQAENRLSVLLGRNPGPIPRGATLDAQHLPPAVPAGLPSSLLERRPDIREAELNLMAASARTRSAIAEFFPKLTLTGSYYGTQSSLLSRLYELPASRIWQLVPTVTLPLFHGGQIRGNFDANRARERQALAAYQQTVLQAFQEVDDALAFQRSASAIRTQRQAQVTAARRSLELANLRYADGLGAYLDVLDAERQFYAAEIDLASVLRDQLTAVVQLYKALGGGWDIALPQQP